MNIWIKKTAGRVFKHIPAKMRYGKEFRTLVNFLYESENWDRARWEDFQYEKTKAVIKHAEDNVPWYKKKFAEWGVGSESFRSISDIKKFPTVTKEDIRDNLNQFISKKTDVSKLKYITTGGSTGIPFGFYQSEIHQNIENAFFTYQWNWYGVKFLVDKSVVLRGYLGDEKNFFAYAPRNNEWHFSMYYLTNKTFIKYFEKINRIKPVFIQAYPSAAELLATYLQDFNKKFEFKMNAVMCGSENLYSGQKDLIEKILQTKVHCWYGQSERVCLATWTKNSNLYHVFPHYGLTELINSEGDQVREEGGSGEIIATSFFNFDMPFIRYKTMDIATKTNQKSPDGLDFELFSRIEGRLQELFLTKTGRLISMTAINMHDDAFDDLKQFQFYQDTPGELIMNIVPRSNTFNLNFNRIKNKLLPKLGSDTKLSINIVQSIPRTKNGKQRFLVQKLPIKHSGTIEVAN